MDILTDLLKLKPASAKQVIKIVRKLINNPII